MTNLNKQIQSATNFLIKQPYRRIQSFEVSGLRFWLKQSEKLDFIVRIQKGNPVVALKQELQGIKDFGDKGIFVPKIVMVGPSYYVMQDTGPTIVNLLHKHNLSEKERIEILENSAEALARLHSKELVHGRPAIKDISYFEGRITFLDLEVIKNPEIHRMGKFLI